MIIIKPVNINNVHKYISMKIDILKRNTHFLKCPWAWKKAALGSADFC